MRFAELWARFAIVGSARKQFWRSTGKCHEPHLLAFFGDMAAEIISADDVIAYREKRSLERARTTGRYTTPATRNRECASLREALIHGVREDLILPTKLAVPGCMPWEHEDNVRRVVLDEQDVLRMVDAAPPWLGALILLSWDHGVMRAHGLNLRWAAVNVTSGAVSVPARGQHRRHPVELSARCLAAISALPRVSDYVFTNPDEGKPFSPSTLHYQFNKVKCVAGHPGLRFDDLRQLRRNRGRAVGETPSDQRVTQGVLSHGPYLRSGTITPTRVDVARALDAARSFHSVRPGEIR